MAPMPYLHLSTSTLLPKTIQAALPLLGTLEFPGARSNPTIDAWRSEVSGGGCRVDAYSDDRVPWCGLFAAVVALRAGKTPPASPLWALNWIRFGVPSDVAALGDVLVFKRETGGHVGFYIAEDNGCYHIIGGNQSDSVNITRVRKSRCVAIRRPFMKSPPESVRPFLVGPNGRVSEDES